MNMKLVAVGGTILGLAVGAAAGYFTAKKQLEAVYDEALEREIAATKQYYAVLNKRDEGFETPEAAVNSLHGEPIERSDHELVGTIIAGARYGKVGTTKIMNVFDSSDDEGGVEQYPDEDAARSADKPYIISKEEFFENDENRSQTTFTYFAGDDVLVDEADMPVDDRSTVGDGNLDRFGHRSGDPRVVYVRNEMLRIEYEICKSEGNFAEEVGGFIKHSAEQHKVRKFRRE